MKISLRMFNKHPNELNQEEKIKAKTKKKRGTKKKK